MSDQFVSAPDPQRQYAPLALWLGELLVTTPPGAYTGQLSVGDDVSLLRDDYHTAFYPQIPDFAMALLKKDSHATTRYAPLLFHLIGCSACHQAYLEMYDALRVALSESPKVSSAALRIPSSTTLATTSPKLLVFLCQLLVGQARAQLRYAHRTHGDQDAWARSLLQQAMLISSSIMQGTLRQRALRDLVEVASLYAASPTEIASRPAQLSYGSLVGSGSSSRGRTLRRVEALSRPQEPVQIELRADSLEGSVTQQDELLLLTLVGLQESLRGKVLVISVPLGTLLEPVRWRGGNPYAVLSTGPVGADGKLTTVLGSTDLRLSDPEERNLVETLFKKLEVRAAA